MSSRSPASDWPGWVRPTARQSLKNPAKTSTTRARVNLDSVPAVSRRPKRARNASMSPRPRSSGRGAGPLFRARCSDRQPTARTTSWTVVGLFDTNASAAQRFAASRNQGWVIGRATCPGWPGDPSPPTNERWPRPPHTRRSQMSLLASVSGSVSASPIRSAANARNLRAVIGAPAGAAVASEPAPTRRRWLTALRSYIVLNRRPSINAV